MSRTSYLWALVALSAAVACSSKEAPAPPAPKEVAAPSPQPPPPAGPYNLDGSLRPAEDTVFDAPVPAAVDTVALEDRWAGYEARASFGDVVAFYRKNLGDGYKAETSPQGAKLSAKDGSADIYIPKPRIAGAPVRIYYFGHKEGAKPPPVVGRAATPSEPQAGLSTGATPPAGRASSSGGGGAPRKNYNERAVQVDGKTVIFYDPLPEVPPQSGPDPNNAAAAGAGGPVDLLRAGPSFRVPSPEGALH